MKQVTMKCEKCGYSSDIPTVFAAIGVHFEYYAKQVGQCPKCKEPVSFTDTVSNQLALKGG